ncbi:hypothetical protein SDC9_101772 [bioreactor metagenome]|uniref:Uncharacterized protein n=1 Tax=bioreactor metagenome TaxID=1076179 RepID=A0A645AP94_9ZZZZ
MAHLGHRLRNGLLHRQVDVQRALQPDGWRLLQLQQHIALVHGRHEGLTGAAIGRNPRHQCGHRHHRGTLWMAQCGVQQRPVQPRCHAHHPGLAVRALLEQQRGQHRHQRERQQQRRAQREHNGQRHRRKQFALQPLQREQGQKRQADDENARSHRHGHLSRRRKDAMQARLLRPGRVRIQAADGVFHHHHRRIHQHADGNRQAAQAHQVGAHARHPHQQKGAQRRQRHHQRHHQCGA